MIIEDSVAVVTGGRSGLGRATSDLLNSMGARVVILDLPSSKSPNEAAQTGGRIAHVPTDVTDVQQAQDVVDPEPFETPIMSSLPRGTLTALKAQVPHPARSGQPHEFARLVGHIVKNSMPNGEVIRLDGAIRMPPR